MRLNPSAFLRFVLLLCVSVLIQRPILAENVVPPTGTIVPEKNRNTTADDPKLVTNHVESTQFTQNISSRSGWQLTSLYVTSGSQFHIDYLSGTWTVDYRNYLYSGPDGYPATVDNRVGYWSYCKNVYSLPYATLLGAIGNGPFFAVRRGGTFTANATGWLYLRINDVDACQTDNDGSINVSIGSSISTACYPLTARASGAEGRVLVLTPQNCNGGYTANTVVQMRAELVDASLNYRFTGWSGSIVGDSHVANVIMNEPKTVVAGFTAVLLPSKPVVVLVHGWHGLSILGSTEWKCSTGIVKFVDNEKTPNDFGIVAPLLKGSLDVYIANLDTKTNDTPSIEQNANCLKNQLLEVRQKTGADMVLIAHSMGGLVSRAYLEGTFLKSETGFVKQLITIGTPHVGTTLADTPCLYAPLDIAACEFSNLGIWSFNARYPNRASKVRYDLIGGDLTPLISGVPLEIYDGPNDGVIGVNSAIGRNYVRRLFQPPLTNNVITGDDLSRFVVHASHSPVLTWWPSYFQNNYFDTTSSTATYRCIQQLLGISGGSCTSATESTSVAGMRSIESDEANNSSLVQTSSGHLVSGQIITQLVTVDTNGPSQFNLTWITGTIKFTLTNPIGTVINPTYADAHPDEVAYFANTSDTTSQLFAVYAFTTSIPGAYTLTLEAGDIGLNGTDYTASTFVNSPRTLTVATDKDFYSQGDVAVITATVQNNTSGLEGATIRAQVYRPGFFTSTISLVDLGSGIYRGAYSIPYVPGNFGVKVIAQGIETGTAYVRQEDLLLGISPANLELSSQFEAIPQDTDGNGKYESLDISIGTQSSALRTYLISADLIGQGNAEVAHSVLSITIGGGSVSPQLSFDGDEIRKSGVNGPYTLTNLTISDLGYVGVPVLWNLQNVWTTSAYSSTDFATSCFMLESQVVGNGVITAGKAANCNDGLQYAAGTLVTLTAKADPGFNFINWSGDISDSQTSVVVVLDRDKTLTANFAAPIPTVTPTSTNTPTATPTHSPTPTLTPTATPIPPKRYVHLPLVRR